MIRGIHVLSRAAIDTQKDIKICLWKTEVRDLLTWLGWSQKPAKDFFA